jgi:energy-coupling factor transport system ATP-binding protein
MGIIKTSKLVHEFIRRDEEGNVESITTALDNVNLDIKLTYARWLDSLYCTG